MTAALAHEARAREERLTGLVDRQGHDLRVVPEERLDTVAVMDVEVEVQDPMPGIAGHGAGQGDVVVDAEARGMAGHGVVQPAARVERVGRLPGQDGGHGGERTAGHRGRRLVHADERGVVAGADAPLGGALWIDREAFDRLDVGGLVETPDRSIIGRRRRQEPVRTELTEEVDTGAEATRREGMEPAEVVRLRARAIDDDGPAVTLRAGWARWARSRVKPCGDRDPAPQATGSQPAASTALRRARAGSVPASSASA